MTSPKTKLPLERLRARVASVTLTGLSRTKDDYIHRAMDELCANVRNVEDLIERTKQTRELLLEHGAFKEVNPVIDVTPNTTHDYNVTFEVRELRRLQGKIETEVNQSGTASSINLTSPNLWGRGERVEFSIGNTSHSFSIENNLGFNAKLTKPFLHTRYGKYRPTTHLHLFSYNTMGFHKSYNLYTRGGLWDFSIRASEFLRHSVQYELAYRELGFNSRHVPLSLREHFGPRLGSFLRYMLNYDDRETNIFPDRGTMFKFCAETDVFGKLGDIHYQNVTAQVEHNIPLPAGFSLQLTGRGGLIGQRFSHADKPIPLNNLFVVGGPYTLRGFDCLAPFDGEFPLGSNMYWATGVHLWAPLPFNSSFSKFGRFFRTHLFYNLGNNNTNSADIRSSWGVGLAIGVFKLARIEINYHIPAQFNAQDRTKAGFDFKLGVDFV